MCDQLLQRRSRGEPKKVEEALERFVSQLVQLETKTKKKEFLASALQSSVT